MSLDEFNGAWHVGTSGRDLDFPKNTKCTIEVLGMTWKLKDSNGQYFDQKGNGYDACRDLIHCTLTIKDKNYHFEAVLAHNKCGDKPVLYGTIFPTNCARGPVGDGAVGGWSAEKQGSRNPAR